MIHKISIIIPTFNSERTIIRCLDSIVAQTYLDKEVLLIDGLSTDNTVQTIRDYASKHSFIRYISEKDTGVYDAMNKGINLANGEWIYFLGSDDYLFDKNVLKRVFDENIDIVRVSDYIYANVIWGDTGAVYDGIFDILKLYRHNICHQGIFVKKSVLFKKGLFSLKYPALADFYFNLLCFTDDSIKKSYLNVIVAYFTFGGISGITKDSFIDEKFHLFEKNIKNISYEILLRFRVKYGNKNGILNKASFLINSVILYIINIFLVRKLREIRYALIKK